MNSTHRNVVFSVIVSVFLASVILSIGLSFTVDGTHRPTKSTLEGRTYSAIPELTLHSLKSHKLQDGMERYLSDAVPNRDIVILANADLQRAVIEAANILFDYDAYHSYFSSNRICVPSHDAVYAIPSTNFDYRGSFINDIANYVTPLIDGNPNIRWFYFLPDTSDITLASPAQQLITNGIDYSEAVQLLQKHIPEACKLIDVHYTDLEEYAQKTFLTDHHLQISGSIDFYRAAIELLGRKPTAIGEPVVCYPEPFYGSNARSALCAQYSDKLLDVDFDMRNISVSVNGRQANSSDIDKTYAQKPYRKASIFDNVYASYFHSDHGLITFENVLLPDSSGSLLLIGDSIDNNCARFFASNYRIVYEFDPRLCAEIGGISVQTFINEHPDITDAIFVLSVPGAKQLLSTHPTSNLVDEIE